MKTIDDIIDFAKNEFDLEIDLDKRLSYEIFLQEQISRYNHDINEITPAPKSGRPTYQQLKLLAIKLKIYSYLMGITPIIAGNEEDTTERHINSVDDLYLLRPRELGSGDDRTTGEHDPRRTDLKLFRLFRRVSQNHAVYPSVYPSWGEMISQILTDPALIQKFGKELTYQDIMYSPSPNKNTFPIGGDRMHLYPKKK